MIKPIKTEFDGHRFRSRLEARWAVFFKEMDWDYSYELEGYRFEYKGTPQNAFELNDLDKLAIGIYFMRLYYNEQRELIKIVN